MAYEASTELAVTVTADGRATELTLEAFSGTFDKFYDSGLIDLPASTQITLYDSAASMAISTSFYVAMVINRHATRTLHVFRFTDHLGADKTSWAEEVPPGGFALIHGAVYNAAFAGEVAAIVGQAAANDTVDIVAAYNPAGATGSCEIVMFAERQ